MDRVWLAISVFFALVGGAIWWVFLRSVPRRTATGTLVAKTHKPAGVYMQAQTGSRQGFWTPTPIPIAECYVIQLRLENAPLVEAWYSLGATAAANYEVGQHVEVDFEVRGIPGIWRRLVILALRPA